MRISFLKKMVRLWQKNDLHRSLVSSIGLGFLSLFYLTCQKIHFFISKQRVKKAPLFVISVGSLCAGGSGKTPLCAWLYDSLKDSKKAFILMRGYRAKTASASWTVKGKDPFVSDEACMLSGFHSENSLKRKVMTSPDRLMGAKKAFNEGFELAILDDGMQHYRLFRDVELVLLDPEDLSQGLLPLGRRREPWSALKRADWILFRDSKPLDVSMFERLHIQSKPYARFSYIVKAWRDYLSCEIHISSLKEETLGLCTGVARPQKVIDLVHSQDLSLQETLLLADHEDLDLDELALIEKRWKAQGITKAMCTEKDYARWSQKKPLSDFWIYPELGLVWHEKEKELLDFIKQHF